MKESSCSLSRPVSRHAVAVFYSALAGGSQLAGTSRLAADVHPHPRGDCIRNRPHRSPGLRAAAAGAADGRGRDADGNSVMRRLGRRRRSAEGDIEAAAPARRRGRRPIQRALAQGRGQHQGRVARLCVGGGEGSRSTYAHRPTRQHRTHRLNARTEAHCRPHLLHPAPLCLFSQLPSCVAATHRWPPRRPTPT